MKENMQFTFLEPTANGVVPKPKPRATRLHLLNKFLIRTNFHLPTKPNNKAETELQTFKLQKSQMRKRCRLEPQVRLHLLIRKHILYQLKFV
jgi:hypothetical protein